MTFRLKGPGNCGFVVRHVTVPVKVEVSGRIDAMLAKVAVLRSLLIERRAALITDVVTGRKRVA